MNPTDGIQPDDLRGSQTSWEQPPRKKRRVVRSPQMMTGSTSP